LKILHVIKSLGRGGAEMLLPETIKLHSKQYEFYVIYFLPWKNQLVKDLEKAGAKVYCFNKTNNVTLLLSFYQLFKFIKQNNIYCVHAHLPWAGFVSRLACKLAKVPLIYTEHNKQERYHGITKWLNKFTFGWQSKVVAVSEDVKISIEQNIGIKYPVKVILNGVNTQSFIRNKELGSELRQQLNIPQEAIIISTIAVFRFQKRLLEWLQIANTILEREKNIYFIMIGDGILKPEIMKTYQDLGSHPNIIFPGLQENVKPWLSATDIYMMTSIFEGLPIAMLEAMSMECAIVSTNAGGIKEVIEQGKNGLLRDVEDWKLLEDDLKELISNKQLREQLAIGARKRVQEFFSLERMVSHLESLYTSVYLIK
jgi:glycosyltransferase involved in cell wall biosynthesis